MIRKEILDGKEPLYVCSVDPHTDRVDIYHDPFGKNSRKNFLDWLLSSKIHSWTKLRIESNIFHQKDFKDCRVLPEKRPSPIQKILHLFPRG
ncbi:MAG: hypothetical protein Q8P80_01775 [Candidatus Levybacteria bacterium]|nr:hypothetical protein [Candidatus Levybacteria bacterium]